MAYKNPEDARAYAAEYRKTQDPEKRKAYMAEWRKKNKPAIKEYRKKYGPRRDRPTYRKWSNEYTKRNNQKMRLAIAQYKRSIGCMNPNCQWKGDIQPYCLDFHHRDPNTKTFNIGGGSVGSRAKLIREIRKCILLCSNCHRMETWGDLDVSQIPLCEIDETNFKLLP